MDKRWRLAIGSFIEDYTNKVSRFHREISHPDPREQVQIVQLDEDRGELMHRATFDHPYPTTKVIWIPDPATHYPDLLATSGDYLRLWRVEANGQVHPECMLNNVSGHPPIDRQFLHVTLLVFYVLISVCILYEYIHYVSIPTERW